MDPVHSYISQQRAPHEAPTLITRAATLSSLITAGNFSSLNVVAVEPSQSMHLLICFMVGKAQWLCFGGYHTARRYLLVSTITTYIE